MKFIDFMLWLGFMYTLEAVKRKRWEKSGVIYASTRGYSYTNLALKDLKELRCV